MKKIKQNLLSTAIAVLLCASIFGCTSSNDFEKGKAQLTQQGYTDIKNTGYNMFCCAEEDTFSTGFECKDKNGKVVKGCFFSTILKSVTIRFE
jgi:hypothetical protein